MAITATYMMPHPPIMVPEIGKGEEKKIEKTVKACQDIAKEIKEIKPDTIIIMSPHAPSYSDYFNISYGEKGEGDFGNFLVPELKYEKEYDFQFIEKLVDIAMHMEFPAGVLGDQDHDLDHGALVPLYFIEKEYTDYKLVHIALSGLPMEDHYKLGILIKEVAAVTGKNTVFIASGDLSHRTKKEGPYGFNPAGPKYDKKIMKVMGNGDFEKLFKVKDGELENAAVCGHKSFVTMAGTLDRRNVSAEALSYEDEFGVGYGVCKYRPGDKNPQRNFVDQEDSRKRRFITEERKHEDPWMKLARETIEKYIKYDVKIPEPANIPREMSMEKAGVFVSLKQRGQLRGCIGTIRPAHKNIACEIMENAILAATSDLRFDPVTEKDLYTLSYSVDVLGKPEPIDSIEQLDPENYGVIVTEKDKMGVLLPNLEGIDTAEKQISIACAKGGISPNSKNLKMERFKVTRHAYMEYDE